MIFLTFASNNSKKTMKKTPIDTNIANEVIAEYHLTDFGMATIREVVAISNELEKKTHEEFIHMEMGVPGLKPAAVGVAAEIEALKSGVASLYPNINGIEDLKNEASRFVKAFMNIEVSPEGCIPVTGSMQGTYASFLENIQRDEKQNTILFIDPGFPVQKQQLLVMGGNYETFDVYHYRGERLKEKLESYLKKGTISAIVYSNPNNPSWICFTEEELKVIGELATQYDAIVIEDLAYFAMDFRKPLGTPFEAPYQATVARYTDNYVLQISGSKAFSYAGQRIGVTVISDALYQREFPALTQRYGGGTYGTVYSHRILYALSSGTSHSAQCAMAAMLKAASDGTFDFVEEIKEYGRRAKRLKEIFIRHGFKIVYDHDMDELIADGFYFTITYPGMRSGELMRMLINYGISAISLGTTGSDQQGLRACTSFIKNNQYELLDKRLQCFEDNLSK